MNWQTFNTYNRLMNTILKIIAVVTIFLALTYAMYLVHKQIRHEQEKKKKKRKTSVEKQRQSKLKESELEVE